MSLADDADSIERFGEFYQTYYRDEISELAQKYPSEQRSLYIDWETLYEYDSNIAHDFVAQPRMMLEYAEEALRLYDLPTDVRLGNAHVRIENLSESTGIRDIGADHVGKLVAVQGMVQKTTDTQPKMQEAAFECQRCGTLTRIPQGSDFEKPHECQGCERQGPFEINFDQSEFVDAQVIHILDDPKSLPDGAAPQSIEIHIEDDIAGEPSVGDRVQAVGILHLDQEDSTGQQSAFFTPYMEGLSIKPLEDERPTGSQSQPTSVTDLSAYVSLAATALSTLPEDAREEETKAKLVTPFVEALGWNKFDGREVRLEYTDSKTSHRPDYALFGPEASTPDVIIEAKQLGTNLDAHEGQLNDYLRVFSAEWGVLTNGEEFYVFNRIGDDALPEKLAEMRIDDLSQATILDSLRRGAFYD